MKRLYRGVEVSTLLLIALCYSAWFACGFLWSSPWWWLGLALMAFVTAFHSSLQHETIHGHPTPWTLFNELLVSLPLGVVYPYRRYKILHLKHHNDINLTCPFEDPESYFLPFARYQSLRPMVRRLLLLNNTFVGRLVLGPLLATLGFSRSELLAIIRGEHGVGFAWLLHGLGMLALWAILTGVFLMPVWVYVLCVVYPSMSLISLRTYAEHQAAENVGARTAIVEANPVLAFLYLNNNLHIAHHSSPQVPWYDLPAFYRERKAVLLAANEHTLFEGYFEIVRRFAFTVKQPVDHPFMHRDQVDGK